MPCHSVISFRVPWVLQVNLALSLEPACQIRTLQALMIARHRFRQNSRARTLRLKCLRRRNSLAGLPLSPRD